MQSCDIIDFSLCMSFHVEWAGNKYLFMFYLYEEHGTAFRSAKIHAKFTNLHLCQGCPTRYTSGATCVAPEKGKEPLDESLQ